MDDYLVHYGIKDQKWYVRRYQNYDGTRTEEGKERERAAYRETSSASKKVKAKKNNKWFEQNIKGGKDKPNVSPAEKVAKEVGNVASSTKNTVESAYKIKKTLEPHKESASKKMSDKELRDAINRLEMERRYDSLTSEETSKGYEVLRESLNVVGSVAATAASVATIYAIFNKVF